ncbi:BspA family leucine-rich repeat surface protein, partial [Psittacicella gerlachiana]
LKEFLDVYIAKFNDINDKPLDLGFLDMRDINHINYLFTSQNYINHLSSLNLEYLVDSKIPRIPLNIDFSTLDLSNVNYMNGTFAGTVIYSDVSQLNVSNVRTMEALFYEAELKCSKIDLGKWDVSKVCSMNLMFNGASFSHQLNLNSWNVSNVIRMAFMFSFCESIREDLNQWDVSNVNKMTGMFTGASKFNGDISNWNVSKVTDMSIMFSFAFKFNRDLRNWNVCRVSNSMNVFLATANLPKLYYPKFVEAIYTDPKYYELPLSLNLGKIKPGEVICKFTNLESLKDFLDEYIARFNNIYGEPLDLSFIDMSQVDTADFLFVEQEVVDTLVLDKQGNILENPRINQTRPLNIDFNSLDFSQVASMNGTFMGVELYGDISKLHLYNVKRMTNTFKEAIFKNSNIDLSRWYIHKVQDISCMFHRAQFNDNKDLSTWDLRDTVNIGATFAEAKNLSGLNISNWDVSNVIIMMGTFANTTDFNSDISDWDTSSVISTSAMFANSISFNGDLSNWNVSNVTSMENMFLNAKAFNSDLSKWNVAKVTNMSSMFEGASSFNQDIGNWDVSNVTDMSDMFAGAVKFNQDISNWNISNVTNIDNMFYEATSFNQKKNGMLHG